MADRAGGKLPAFLGGTAVTDPIPPAPLVRAHLDRIVSSPAFVKASRLQAFLRFVVEQTLAGRQDTIKEYAIATEVCGRPPTFDAKTDPIVRVDANRLRARLDAYYRLDGRDDSVRIHLPKGSYVPAITSACLARPPDARSVTRGAAVCRSGSRARRPIVCRRPRRGADSSTQHHTRAPRDREDIVVPVSQQGSPADRRGSRRGVRRRGFGAIGRPSDPCDGSAHRDRGLRRALVRPVRTRAERCVRRAGRHLPEYGCRARTPARPARRGVSEGSP